MTQIVVLEDNPVQFEALTRVLSNDYRDIDWYRNPHELLAAILKDRELIQQGLDDSRSVPDVICILDWRMVDEDSMSGGRIIPILRALRLRTVLYSAYLFTPSFKDTIHNDVLYGCMIGRLWRSMDPSTLGWRQEMEALLSAPAESGIPSPKAPVQSVTDALARNNLGSFWERAKIELAYRVALPASAFDGVAVLWKGSAGSAPHEASLRCLRSVVRQLVDVEDLWVVDEAYLEVFRDDEHAGWWPDGGPKVRRGVRDPSAFQSARRWTFAVHPDYGWTDCFCHRAVQRHLDSVDPVLSDCASAIASWSGDRRYPEPPDSDPARSVAFKGFRMTAGHGPRLHNMLTDASGEYAGRAALECRLAVTALFRTSPLAVKPALVVRTARGEQDGHDAETMILSSPRRDDYTVIRPADAQVSPAGLQELYGACAFP